MQATQQVCTIIAKTVYRRTNRLEAVNLPSVPESYYDDCENVIVNYVDDPIITNAHSITVPALQWARSRGSRVFCKQFNGATDAWLNGLREFP